MDIPKLKAPASIYQTANASAMFLVASSVVSGIGRALGDSKVSAYDLVFKHWEIWVLALFIVGFRLKTTLDDLKHFHDADQFEDPTRQVGFVLAIVSWVLWGIAGQCVVNTGRSAYVMAGVLCVSTLWIFVHMIEIVQKKQWSTDVGITRFEWIFLNAVYATFLCLHAVCMRHNELLLARLLLCALVGVLVYDAVISGTFSNLPHEEAVVSTPAEHR